MSSGFPGRSPREAGFRMPAEWGGHARCWMAWPHRPELWRGRLEAAQAAWAAVARAVREFEPVSMIAHPDAAGHAARSCGPDVEVLPIPIDDSWSRDSGPTFLRDGEGRLAGTAWRFNAWGGKHQPFDDDARLAGRLLDHLGLPVHRAPIFLEGGALHVDGEGTVLTTESVVFNANRNPGLGRAEAERVLCDALGATKIVWLPGDPDERETDGHVDGIACFIRPGAVLCEINPDPAHPHHAILEENRRALAAATDARGRRLELVAIEEAVGVEATSDVYCRSYINFYLANGGVVAPGYGIAADARVREVLAKVFPGRRVVQVDVRDIAPGGGGIHCITQQQPA